MSDATTPANPTDQIATTPAVLSPEPPIVPTSGTKRVPDDSEVVQRYDWRLDLHLLDRRARDKYEEGDGYETDRLTAYIERLEAERVAAERVVEAARYCCIALSDDGTSIDLCIQTGERDGEPLYAFVDEVDQWQNAERLLLALTDYDAAFAMATVTASRLEAERDALLAEHEAVTAMLPVCGVDAEEEGCDDTCDTCTVRDLLTAHDNAERVIHGE